MRLPSATSATTILNRSLVRGLRRGDNNMRGIPFSATNKTNDLQLQQQPELMSDARCTRTTCGQIHDDAAQISDDMSKLVSDEARATACSGRRASSCRAKDSTCVA